MIIDWEALERCRGDVAEIEAIERVSVRRRGGDQRGNVTDRRRRKLWLIDTFGDGEYVACRFCWTTVDYAELCVDRIVPGHMGGKYVRDNIQPVLLAMPASAGCGHHEREARAMIITALYYVALGLGALVCLTLTIAAGIVLVGVIASAAAAAAVEKSENGS